MKLGGSGQVAAAVLLCAAVSDAGTSGSEAKLPEVGRQQEAELGVAKAGPLSLPRSETDLAWHLVLLDHEGNGTGDAGPDEWATAVAELKTEWDLTGMVDGATAPAGSAVPQRNIRVANDDGARASSGPKADGVTEVTGSNLSIPVTSGMAIDGHEDR